MRLLIGIVLALALIMISCTTGNVVNDNTVKIGMAVALTGPSSDGGEYEREGALLALEEINNNPNYKYNYEILFEDTQYNPQTGATVLKKLIDIDKVQYVVGAHGSSVTLAMAPIAEQNKVILISPASQSNKVSEAGDYIFRTQIHTKQEISFFADYLKPIINEEPLHLLLMNTAYADSIIQSFDEYKETNDFIIGTIQKIDVQETDYRTYLLKLKKQNAKYVLLAMTRKMAGNMLMQAKELDMDIIFFATSGAIGSELITTAGSAAEGLVFPYPYDAESDDSIQRVFREKYYLRYNAYPEMLAANAYDALYILTWCIEEAHNVPDAVKDCIYQIAYNGAGGKFSFDENGDAVKEFIIKTVKNGEFVKMSS